MKRHPIRPNYDPYNCNSGIPHIPDTHWDPHSKAWEFNDVQLIMTSSQQACSLKSRMH